MRGAARLADHLRDLGPRKKCQGLNHCFNAHIQTNFITLIPNNITYGTVHDNCPVLHNLHSLEVCDRKQNLIAAFTCIGQCHLVEQI